MNPLLDRQYTLHILKKLFTDYKDMDAYSGQVILGVNF